MPTTRRRDLLAGKAFGDLDGSLLRELRAKHTLDVRERTRAFSFKTAGWVNGERVRSTVDWRLLVDRRGEANIGAYQKNHAVPFPEDCDGDVAKRRAAGRASAGTARRSYYNTASS